MEPSPTPTACKAKVTSTPVTLFGSRKPQLPISSVDFPVCSCQYSLAVLGPVKASFSFPEKYSLNQTTCWGLMLSGSRTHMQFKVRHTQPHYTS